MAMMDDASRDWAMRESFEAYEPGEEQYRVATQWLLRLREADRTSSRAFERWRDADPMHRFAYAEVEAIFKVSAYPSRALGPYVAGRRRWWRSRRVWRSAIGAMAACLLLVIGIGQGDRIVAIGADAATAAGGHMRYAMADGTRITLNTRSVIDADVEMERRGVRLRRGEAFFEVAKDPARPFLVHAGDARISVLGTKFNVRIDGARTFVSVIEGHVRVASTKGLERTVDLVVGQEAMVEGAAVTKRAADLFVVNAWRRGQAIFLRARLRDAVHELNRYRETPLYILDRDLADDRVTGVFRWTSLAAQ